MVKLYLLYTVKIVYYRLVCVKKKGHYPLKAFPDTFQDMGQKSQMTLQKIITIFIFIFKLFAKKLLYLFFKIYL
jgi:hypothetical protein